MPNIQPFARTIFTIYLFPTSTHPITVCSSLFFGTRFLALCFLYFLLASQTLPVSPTRTRTRTQPASYGKKNGMWYASPGNQGWGSKPASRKPSIMEADLGTLSTTSGSIKRSAGRVIRIINNLDHSVQVSFSFECRWVFRSTPVPTPYGIHLHTIFIVSACTRHQQCTKIFFAYNAGWGCVCVALCAISTTIHEHLHAPPWHLHEPLW